MKRWSLQRVIDVAFNTYLVCVIIIAVVAWSGRGIENRARVYYYLHRVLNVLAYNVGKGAIAAEKAYWSAVGQ